MSSPDWGEVGGIFAGVTVLLAAIGRGIRWWLGWTDRRAESRAAKLDAWQRELTDREARFDERIEGRLAELEKRDRVREGQMLAMRTAFERVSGALRLAVPGHPALGEAEDIMKAAYTVDPATPADMTKLVLRAKRMGEDQ